MESQKGKKGKHGLVIGWFSTGDAKYPVPRT